MLTSEFDYHLPTERIAQAPVEPRDASRLLVVHRDTGAFAHCHFRDITTYLRPGDVLVANETRVIPARLRARKHPSGGSVEVLLLARRDPLRWEALVRGRRVPVGQRLTFTSPGHASAMGVPAASVEATVEAITPSGGRLLRFDEPVDGRLASLGEVPLPPYIHQALADPQRYQTVYARTEGSTAAPTAGLHFTPDLIARTQALGVEWTTVLLHIGLDTFRPVTEERIEDHRIHTEYCRLSAQAAATINRAESEGRRVIAVGTTSVRVLETAARAAEGAGVRPWDGPTDLFITPGYRFRVVDALVTNFHLPRSSLLMLVSAFASRDLILRAYEEAIREGYRFYSLGDGMLIL
ncbi:MAG TPA: tRNA preQ1(34) S-adenosylmethionine ribosyltransferase-isomerase QueA [Chloroflexi bacterium]|nr:tRNA preQ1(34) S-adenosylmethionine ribosyltransferase-isomerase QueA [Chloroflexota bacterium]